jgi:hypothetical protein
MNEQRNQLPQLKIASPCSADWDSMVGDERVRFCGQCNLHVYNISEMSRDAASALISSTDGRLCARFYRRSDGTVLTRDCPTGLRAIRARASRAAGAALSTILSLFSGVSAQTTSSAHPQDPSRPPITIKRTFKFDTQDDAASLTGTVYDQTGEAVIPGAKITLLNNITKKEQATISNEEGVFRIEGLEFGEYILSVESVGFRTVSIQLYLSFRELAQVDVILEVLTATMGEIVVFSEEKELENETPPPLGTIKPRS